MSLALLMLPASVRLASTPIARIGLSAPTIRELESRDLWPVGRLLRVSFAPESNALSGALISGEHVLGLRERRLANHHLVATNDDGAVVGFVECFTPEFLASAAGENYPERVRRKLNPYIASLCVAAAERGRGVGTALMRGIESRVLAGAPPHALSLEVEEGDTRAIALYTRLGYEIVGRDEDGRRLVGDAIFGRSERVTKLKFEKRLGLRYE